LKRAKRRYLALKLESQRIPDKREFTDAIWDAITRLYGEVGASMTGLVLINFYEEKGFFIIRVSLASLPFVRSSLASVTAVAGEVASIHVLAVSGTIKALLAKIY
jgi:RNase P/RNase MRP subunit POP5